MAESRKLLSPKGAKSYVWQYFGFESTEAGDVNERKIIHCKLCDKELRYSGNTTNLGVHLRNHHPEVPTPSVSTVETQATLSQCGIVSKAKHVVSAKRCEQITYSVCKFIAKDMRPVEGEGFREMLNVLEPGYSLPCRKTLTKRLFDIQGKTAASIREELSATEYISLTADFWTSAAMESYLGVTCHFVTPSWELKNYVLQTRSVPESHTAVNVASNLQAVVMEWDLSTKLQGISTDNGRNIVNAVKENLCWKHIPCFGHTLQLAIKSGLDLPTVSALATRCRKLVGHFRHSYIAQRALSEKQKRLDLPVHKLKQDVPTRWNSTFDMFDRIVEQQQAITAVLLESKHPSDRNFIVSGDTIILMESLTMVLKPLALATTMLCVEKLPSLSLVQPVLSVLLKHHLAVHENDVKDVVDLKNMIARGIKIRFSDPDLVEVMNLSTALDPRFKLLKHLPSSDRPKVWSGILAAMQAIQQARIVSDSSSPEPAAKRQKSDFFDVSDSSSTDGSEVGIQTALEHELLQYQAMKEISRTDNPLEFWKVNEHKFNMLAVLARQFHCLCATSVPAERLFSKAGMIVTQKRASLAPKTVDCLCFLSQNL